MITNIRFRLLFAGVYLVVLLPLQGQDTVPEWAPIGATWHYLYGGGIGSNQIRFIRIQSIKDTVIKNTPCKMLTQTLFHDHEGDEDDLGNIYVHQDGNKVYYYVQDSFHILYNFDAEPGDSVLIANPERSSFLMNSKSLVVIDSTFTTEIDGIIRKGQKMRILDNGAQWPHLNETILETIGNLYYLTPYFDHVDCDHACPFLNCYEDPNITYRHPSVIPCDTIWRYTIGVRENSYTDNITMVPNPVKRGQKLEIRLEDSGENKFEYFRISDIRGKIWLQEKWPADQVSIDIPHQLSEGIYLVALLSRERQIVKKITVVR